MERLGLTLGRIVLIVASVAGAVLLIVGTDGSPAMLVAAGVLLLAVGAVVNRFWAAWLPVAVVGGWLAFIAVAYGTSDGHDFTWEQVALFLLAVAGGFTLCLLVGVAIRRALRGRERGPAARA